MLHGRTGDRNLNDEEFWPIFEIADALRAPVLAGTTKQASRSVD